MLNPRPALRRIPLVRPLRPPNKHDKPPRPRPFTKNAQLLLVSPASPRPQLPFLSPSSHRFPTQQRNGQWQARLISTETKRYIREQVWLASKWTFYLWTFGGLLFVMSLGLQNEKLERKYPSPHEWRFWTRMAYRSARGQDSPDWHDSGMIDWAAAGYKYKQTLARLETPELDGKDLVPQPGVPGYDLRNKSEAWRRGYFEVLIGCARMAEHLDGWLRDNTRGVVFPPEVVRGPSNPHPRPVPPGAASAPHEKDCSPAFEPADVFYDKLLTTTGFSTRQRLDATVAYADYLSFKGRVAAAEQAYKAALDIAAAALPDHGASVVDPDTGVIKEHAAAVSLNVLHAATQLALHHARTSNVSGALPILLSVLRARRAAPVSTTAPAVSSSDRNASASWTSSLLSLISPPAYPPSPPSGNAPFTRRPGPDCDEAALMTYIGEILFASSSSPAPSASSSARAHGVNWTREAVAEAERGAKDAGRDREDRARCAQCLEVGLQNWRKMVARLAREEREAQRQGGEGKAGSGGGWRRLLGGGGGGGGGAKREEQGAAGGDAWQSEEKAVLEKIEQVRKEGLAERFKAAGGHTPGGLWI